MPRQIPSTYSEGPRHRFLLVELNEHQSYDGNRPGDVTLTCVIANPGGSNVRNGGGLSGSDRTSTYAGWEGSTDKHPLSDGMLGNFEIFGFLDAAPDKYRQDKSDTSPRGLWMYQYRFHSVYEIENAEQALTLAEVLRHVQKALDKAEKAAGPPASFGWYCHRIGQALGAKGILVRQNATSRSFYSDNEYRVIAWRDGAAEKIDRLVAQWIEERQPKQPLALASGE